MRNVIGAVLAALGVAATLVSPWQSWYNGRHGSTYKFWEVFGSGVTPSRSGVTDSVFLVFLITGVVAMAGVLMRSKALVVTAGVIALAFSVLWMVRQGQAAGQLVITTNGTGLGQGVANALGGSALMLIGGLLMTGRPRQVVVERPADTASTRAYDAGRTHAGAATSDVHVPTKSGSATFTPEESAALDKLQDPPKS